jgi:protein-disulfide reductase (glutathione)
MTRLTSILLALALFFMPALSLARPAESADAWNGSQIDWRSMQSGVKEATTTGKTVVLVFHASWCSSCKRYREVFKDPAVVEATRNYVMVLVDVDKEPQVNGAFSPDGTYVPRTLFISPEGDVRKDLIGKTDPEHPHTIDITGPDELLSLLKRGLPDGHEQGKPVHKGTDQQAAN